MLRQLIARLSAPKRLSEVEHFLQNWAPCGVEVINDRKHCCLHFGGMVYSLDYDAIPDANHVPFMSEHLELHKWALQLAGGIYSHRSLLEAWVRHYLPSARVLGASPNNIVHADEVGDRPLWNGEHSIWYVTHDNKFVTSTRKTSPLPWLTMELKRKTNALLAGETIYIPA
ncbi:hypothetical protein OKW49_006210 [Paraburkholderia youngii]